MAAILAGAVQSGLSFTVWMTDDRVGDFRSSLPKMALV